jgi:hypothetical protein
MFVYPLSSEMKKGRATAKAAQPVSGFFVVSAYETAIDCAVRVDNVAQQLTVTGVTLE